MNYLDALRELHAAVAPGFYVEIGCRNGASLALADCPRLAIDPAPEITEPMHRPTRIYSESSDAFFARPDVAAILGQPPDLAFIDGMHLVEYALRDFINLEARSHPGTVIAIDDVAPGDAAWASRERQTQAWTGDVYRLIPILREYRPDLGIGVFDVAIETYGKGLAVLSGLDPESTVLSDAYEEIAARIEAGDFTAPDTAAIHAAVGLRPAGELAAHLARLAPAPPPPESGAALYLDLIKKALLNEIYRENDFRLYYLRECLKGAAEFDMSVYLDLKGHRPEDYETFKADYAVGRFFRRDISNQSFTHTMMGRARMDSLHDCLDLVRTRGVPGDMVECGVWRGGGCIFMAAYLKAHRLEGRRVLVADSFRGLPPPRDEKDDGIDLTREKFPELAVPREMVQENFATYGLLDDRVVFLEGWFCDTLPEAPTEQIAVLRLDGDLYSSTMDALTALYDKVPEGGVVIVDDYGVLKSCEQAVRDFFASRDEALPEIVPIDWTGVYWIKTAPRPAEED